MVGEIKHVGTKQIGPRDIIFVLLANMPNLYTLVIWMGYSIGEIATQHERYSPEQQVFVTIAVPAIMVISVIGILCSLTKRIFPNILAIVINLLFSAIFLWAGYNDLTSDAEFEWNLKHLMWPGAMLLLLVYFPILILQIKRGIDGKPLFQIAQKN